MVGNPEASGDAKIGEKGIRIFISNDG